LRTTVEHLRPTTDERTVMPGISKSTLIRGGAIGAAVAGGALAGALLLAPAASVAQDPTPSPEASTETTPGTPESPGATPAPETTESPTPDDDELCDHFWHGGFGGFGTVADALGISDDELRDALRDGKSIATIAEERGVELQTVVDAMVTAGTERIDEALADGRIDEDEANELKAELPDRVNDVVQREGWPWGPGRWGWGEGRWGWWGPGPGPGGLGGLDAAAEALGIEEDALWDALRDGRSIADVAAEQGVDLQAVQEALVAEATERIDAALADGRLDEDEANELKAELPERVGAFVQGSAPWWPGWHDGPGDDDDDEPAGTEQPSSADRDDRFGSAGWWPAA
jgi:uncharacterized protein (DUF2267 family)